MEKAEGELVSVIVPAFNAQRTIDKTLLSVRQQTHRNLDIVVVDDGSTDETYRIASGQSLLDDRIRIIRQPNKGVAAARNRGIAEARADFVATIDADDVWRPSKIARQVKLLDELGPKVKLVYAWSAHIDGDGNVIKCDEGPKFTGDVLPTLCYGNFVGNGSSALIRKATVVELGGYDMSLRDRQAQGCEDWSLFLRIAATGHFAVVPEFLTGYRQAADAMSRNVAQMLRSDALVRSEMMVRHPEYLEQIRFGRLSYFRWLFQRELECRNFLACVKLLGMLCRKDDTRPDSVWTTSKCALRMIENVLRAAAARCSNEPSSLRGKKFSALPDSAVSDALAQNLKGARQNA